MRRLACVLGAVAIASVLVMAGCGGSNEQAPASESPSAAPATATPAASATPPDITFKSNPEPPKMGDNQFEVMVMGGDGKPITDAEVSVAFYMAAMPSMNMPEMRSTIPLQHDADGRYRGTGNVAMAGAWDATVMVMRGGQEIGNKKFNVTAK